MATDELNDDELMEEDVNSAGDLTDYDDDIDDNLLLLAPEGELACTVIKAEFKALNPNSEGVVNKDWEELRILCKIVDGDFTGDVATYSPRENKWEGEIYHKPPLIQTAYAAANSINAAKKRQGTLKRLAETMGVELSINPKTGNRTLNNFTADVLGARVTGLFKRVEKDGVAYTNLVAFRPSDVPEAEVG